MYAFGGILTYSNLIKKVYPYHRNPRTESSKESMCWIRGSEENTSGVKVARPVA